MPSRLILLAVLALLVVSGCRKSDSPTPGADSPATSQEIPTTPKPPAADTAAITEADLSGVLAGLTQAVRKFGFEKQRMPKDLEELVAAGYLSAMPTAPAGKKFAINEKKVQVVLTGR